MRTAQSGRSIAFTARVGEVFASSLGLVEKVDVFAVRHKEGIQKQEPAFVTQEVQTLLLRGAFPVSEHQRPLPANRRLAHEFNHFTLHLGAPLHSDRVKRHEAPDSEKRGLLENLAKTTREQLCEFLVVISRQISAVADDAISVGDDPAEEALQVHCLFPAGFVRGEGAQRIEELDDTGPASLPGLEERSHDRDRRIGLTALPQKVETFPEKPQPLPKARPRETLEDGIDAVVSLIAGEVMCNRNRRKVLEVDFKEVVGRIVTFSDFSRVPVAAVAPGYRQRMEIKDSSIVHENPSGIST